MLKESTQKYAESQRTKSVPHSRFQVDNDEKTVTQTLNSSNPNRTINDPLMTNSFEDAHPRINIFESNYDQLSQKLKPNLVNPVNELPVFDAINEIRSPSRIYEVGKFKEYR